MAEVKAAPKSPKTGKAVANIKGKKPIQAKPEMAQERHKTIQPLIHSSSFQKPANLSGQSQQLTNRTLWRSSIQTKLKVGQPGDKYEQEADAMADKVVHTKPEIQPMAKEEEPGLQMMESEEPEVQAMVEEELPEVQTSAAEAQGREVQATEEEEPAVQMMAEEEPEVQTQAEEEESPGIQTMEEEEPAVQMMTGEEPEVQAAEEEEPAVQMTADEEPEVQAASAEGELPEVQAASAEGARPEVQASSAEAQGREVQGKDNNGNASDGFESQLNASRSGGSPLSTDTLNQVQPHFNADFSSVRVHTDSNAVQMNQQLGSQAFAHQNNIYFNEGKYNPGSPSGDHLIAHELTHTVQQGAVVQTKPEEEAEEDIQPKAEAHLVQQQTADTPVDDGADTGNPAANDDSSGTDGLTANNTENNTAPPADTGSDAAGNPGASPAPGTTGTDNQANGQTDLNKDNPITSRAADYKEEEIKPVEALGMDGHSEQAMASFTGASASQVAMSLPGLGDTMTQKLGGEKQSAAQEAPKLTAGTTGVKDQKLKNADDPGNGKNADLKDGVTEAEPGPQQLDPYREGAPRPSYRVDDKADKGKPEKAESGGFFSWLFDKFKNMMGGIKTQDNGLNTKAGAAPKVDTKGKANPDRAKNVSKEGKDQVNKEKDQTATEINKNPGKENIQPLYFEEPKEVAINTEVQTKVVTEQDKAMNDFVTMPLPESVRKQADQDMAPTLEKSMAQPREQTKMAATKRDTDKQAAIAQSQAEVEKLNKDAEKQQQDAVEQNRKTIADEQKKGIEEANTQMNAFSTEADKEQQKASKEVKDRIAKDQAEGQKKLKQAEADAAKEKKKGEAQAKAEKEAAKKKSEDKSWWGKFKDAVSSAVSWVTEKIGKIFDAIRKAVKVIIDAAKNAALALIEAGRKWVVDKLDKFGNWLKEKANKYLKHFPALRKRINGFIDKTVAAAKAVVNKIADGLKKGVEALANGLSNAINSVLNAFETALTAAVQFAGAMLKGDFKEALKIAFFATCKVAGIDPNPILNFINKAGETINIIFKDPAAFFGHVANGVKTGIGQFVTNIKKHLISGLIGWLTGAMSDVPIQMPEKFDLKGVFSLVMQILGLTYDRIRAKVVKKIGPKGEQVVSAMETTFQFVKDLITKGPIVLWERIKEKFTEIKEMAMEKIRNLVTIEVVKAGIKWVLGLLNPASAIVKAVLMLYDFVMFLVERKDQIIGFVTAVFDTVGPLARGQIKNAANAVEGAMGRGVPVILGLLANLAGLGGIGKSVSKVIKTIQKPVDKVVDPIIGWLVKQGKKLWKKGKAGAKKLKDKVFNLLGLKKGFKTKDGKSHTIKFRKKGDRYEPVRASIATHLGGYIQTKKKEIQDAITAGNTTAQQYKPAIEEAERLYNLMEPHVLKKPAPGSNKVAKDKYFGKKDGDKVREYTEKITLEFAKIPDDLDDADSKMILPDTRVGFPVSKSQSFTNSQGKSVKSVDGMEMHADTLTLKSTKHAGSAARHKSNLYSELSDKGHDVVAGHLLNHQTFGSGTEPKNLAPIPAWLNHEMAGAIEHELKKKVLNERKVLTYVVKMDYNTPASDGEGLPAGTVYPSSIKADLSEKQLKPEHAKKSGPALDQAKENYLSWKIFKKLKSWAKNFKLPPVKGENVGANIVIRIIGLIDKYLKQDPFTLWTHFIRVTDFYKGKGRLGNKIPDFDTVQDQVKRQFYAKQIDVMNEKYHDFSSELEGYIQLLPTFRTEAAKAPRDAKNQIPKAELIKITERVFKKSAGSAVDIFRVRNLTRYRTTVEKINNDPVVQGNIKLKQADFDTLSTRFNQFKTWFDEAKDGTQSTSDAQRMDHYRALIDNERVKIGSKKETTISPTLDRMVVDINNDQGSGTLTASGATILKTEIEKLKNRVSPAEGRFQEWVNAVNEYIEDTPTPPKTWAQFYDDQKDYLTPINAQQRSALEAIFPKSSAATSGGGGGTTSTKSTQGQVPISQVPQSIAPKLESSKGQGQILHGAISNNVSQHTGADLSGVRVHTGSSAIEMNREMNSEAFTHGTDIYFNAGRFNTNTQKGKHLLAHELTHVAQHKEKLNLYPEQTTQKTKVQTKLTIGQPNDPYEQEADRVADRVVNSSSAQGEQIQKECDACGQEEPLQKMEEEAQPSIQRMEEEEVQAKTEKGNSRTATNWVSQQVQQSKGQGRPLPTATRQQMGAGIGADFSKVRIHADSKAHDLNTRLNAQAFAVGSDVYFNKGKYNPESKSGKHLLAHELTHTVQQGKSVIRKQEPPETVAPPTASVKTFSDRLNFDTMEEGQLYATSPTAPVRVKKTGTQLTVEFTGSLAGTPSRTLPEKGYDVKYTKASGPGILVNTGEQTAGDDIGADLLSKNILYTYKFDGSKARRLTEGLASIYSGPTEVTREETTGLITETDPSSVIYSMASGKLKMVYERSSGVVKVSETGTGTEVLNSSTGGYKKALDVRMKINGTGEILLEGNTGFTTLKVDLTAGTLLPGATVDEATVKKQQAIIKSLESEYGINFKQEGRMLSLQGAEKLQQFLNNLTSEAKTKVKSKIKKDGFDFTFTLSRRNKESQQAVGGTSLTVGGQLLTADEEVAYIHEFMHFMFNVMGLNAFDQVSPEDLEKPANSKLNEQVEHVRDEGMVRNQTKGLQMLSTDTSLNQAWLNLLKPLDTGSVTTIAIPPGTQAVRLAKESFYGLAPQSNAGHPEDNVTEFMASFITTLTFSRSKFIAAVKEGKVDKVAVSPLFGSAWDQLNSYGLNLGTNPF